jgi:hypothetical protein
MGYGHLRAAHAIGRFLGNQEVLLVDGPPLANDQESKLWNRVRGGYEALSRAGRLPVFGPILGATLERITSVPERYPRRDLSAATPEVRTLEWLGSQGLGRGLISRLHEAERTLLSTFFAPAVLADNGNCTRLFCVVTDSDVNRVWASRRSSQTHINYFTPGHQARRRLEDYGVPEAQIVVSGFPLPHELVGGPDATHLRANLARRLVALDPLGRFRKECREEIAAFLGDLPGPSPLPPHLVFAVGGAGAQSEMPGQFLPTLARLLKKKQLRLTLVAGLREHVAREMEAAIAESGLEPELREGAVQILRAENHAEYFSKFNRLLAEADMLWTKPSELSFYAALGLPLILARPIGSHEVENSRWVLHSGAGVRQAKTTHAGEWISELLKDGTLAGAAWSGYLRMPKFGLYHIVERVFGSAELAARLAAAGPA